MTIEECYKKMGANYQDVIKRLPSVSMIEKFALKFREDTSFQELETALNEKQVDLAFRAAHTLKGVCMNLGFDHLYKPSFEITESLRASNLDLALQQFDAVKEQYSKTIAALNEFAAQISRRGLFLLLVNKCKIISILSCKFSENEYNNLHKQRKEEVQK